MVRTRRSLLRAGGVAAILGLAGCGESGDVSTPDTEGGSGSVTSTAASGGDERAVDPASLPAGALWLPPTLDPPGFAPGRFVRQVSAGAVTDNESRLHPAVYDAYAAELWDRPGRLFGLPAESIDAKYQLPGGGVRVLSGSFDPERVGEYLGRPFEHRGQRSGLRLFVRTHERGEELVAVDDSHLVAGGRDSATAAIQARFGVPDPLPLVDDRVGEAAAAVADADLLTVHDRYNRGRRGLLGNVRARAVAWTFEGDRTRLTAPFVFRDEATADTSVVREWTGAFRGLETYENVSLSRDGRTVTVDATTPTAAFDGGVSGDPGD